MKQNTYACGSYHCNNIFPFTLFPEWDKYAVFIFHIYNDYMYAMKLLKRHKHNVFFYTLFKICVKVITNYGLCKHYLRIPRRHLQERLTIPVCQQSTDRDDALFTCVSSFSSHWIIPEWACNWTRRYDDHNTKSCIFDHITKSCILRIDLIVTLVAVEFILKDAVILLQKEKCDLVQASLSLKV